MTIHRRAISTEQKAERRQAIVDAATALFDKAPFDDVSMALVGKRSKIVKGTIYRYFSSKEHLFLAVYEQQMEEALHVLGGELEALACERERLSIDSLVRCTAQPFVARPALLRLSAILHTGLEWNIDLNTAVAFKKKLYHHLSHIGGLLEAVLPGLGLGEGVSVLIRVNAMIIGVQHMSQPAPVVVEAVAKALIPEMEVDFEAHFTSMLRDMYAGLLARPAT